jgi:hypothetical protein
MLVKNSAVLIFKNSAALKHKYLLDYMLDNPDIEVATVLNDRAFSIYTHGGDSQQKFWNLFAPMEYKWILKKNGIKADRITLLHSLNDIREDDIVILYNLLSDTFRKIENVHAFKALSFLHFHGNASDQQHIDKANVNAIFNEVDLSKSCALFKKYYHVSAPWYVIPFIPAERFKNYKPFAERKNKAFSVGTITYKTHPEFIDVYGDPCDQPIRKAVKDNPDFFADTADCYSSDYNEDDTVKKVLPSDNKFIATYKRVYNRLHNGRQKKYFSFNMVEKFNDYKMHVVGEEILGIPGIGYVEGMACGSAYIGLDSPMYRDLGLIPGVHYIAYDGTKEGLRSTIEYWQRPENQEELEKIAAAGCKFVRENFRGDKVARSLIENLIAEQKKWLNSKKGC